MKRTILAIVMIALPVSNALAVSLAVKIACRDDYFAHCSMHAVGSPGLRQCMRDVGPRLSTQCISALIASGEVKNSTVVAYKKKHYAQKIVATKQYAQVDTKKQYAKAKKQYAEKIEKKKKRYAEKLALKQKYAKKHNKQLARS